MEDQLHSELEAGFVKEFTQFVCMGLRYSLKEKRVPEHVVLYLCWSVCE